MGAVYLVLADICRFSDFLYYEAKPFTLVVRYSLKFTCWSLLVLNSLVTRCKFACYSLQKLLVAKNRSLPVAKFNHYSLQKLLFVKNHSLLVAKFARYLFLKFAPYKESLVTRCKIHSLLAAEVVCCKKSLVTRCKIRFYLLLKTYLLLVAKFARYSLQKLLLVKNHLLLVTKFSCYWLHKNYYWTGARQLKVAATDIKYFARSTFSRRLVLKKNFSLTSSSQLRIRILSREVGYLFWVWIDSEKSRKRQ